MWSQVALLEGFRFRLGRTGHVEVEGGTKLNAGSCVGREAMRKAKVVGKIQRQDARRVDCDEDILSLLPLPSVGP